MIIVLDASAAVGFAVNRSETDEIADWLARAEWVTAPDIFIPEVTNTMWKYHTFENLPLKICENILDDTVRLVDEVFSSSDLYREASSFACHINHTVYDSLYLILARRLNAYLLTPDKKLKALAKNNNIKSA